MSVENSQIAVHCNPHSVGYLLHYNKPFKLLVNNFCSFPLIVFAVQTPLSFITVRTEQKNVDWMLSFEYFAFPVLRSRCFSETCMIFVCEYQIR